MCMLLSTLERYIYLLVDFVILDTNFTIIIFSETAPSPKIYLKWFILYTVLSLSLNNAGYGIGEKYVTTISNTPLSLCIPLLKKMFVCFSNNRCIIFYCNNGSLVQILNSQQLRAIVGMSFERESTVTVTGSVVNKKRKGSKILEECGQIEILGNFGIDQYSSIRTVAFTTQISVAPVHKTLKLHKLHPYKLHTVKELYEDDFDRRSEFSEIITNEIKIHEKAHKTFATATNTCFISMNLKTDITGDISIPKIHICFFKFAFKNHKNERLGG